MFATSLDLGGLLAALSLLPVFVQPARATEDIFVQDAEVVSLTNQPDGDGFHILLARPDDSVGNDRQSVTVRVPVMARAEPYRQWLDEAAAVTGVDVRLLEAVAAIESGFNPLARSSKGAVGIMQLIPATARRYGVADAREPRQNIIGGARYLADLLHMFDNDAAIALAAYNAGEQAVIRYGRKIPPYRETLGYVPRVMQLYSVLSSRSM